MSNQLAEAAQAVIERWDCPLWDWEMESPTADLIHALRQALAAHEASLRELECPPDPEVVDRELAAHEASKPAEPVAWRQPNDTANVRELVWLREKGAVFLGYYFKQPFREHRDADGCYTGQQDAEEYWARYEDGDRCEPDGWHPLQAPVAAPVAVAEWMPIETAPKDGTTVLTFRLLNGEPQICDARYFALGDAWGQRSWRYPSETGPTHWMPLPPAPEMKP